MSAWPAAAPKELANACFQGVCVCLWVGAQLGVRAEQGRLLFVQAWGREGDSQSPCQQNLTPACLVPRPYRLLVGHLRPP